MIRVVHIRTQPRGKRVVVDRTSKWGNPYRMKGENDRDNAIRFYRNYLKSRPELVHDLMDLNPDELACWCAPRECHAEILREAIEEYYAFFDVDKGGSYLDQDDLNDHGYWYSLMEMEEE